MKAYIDFEEYWNDAKRKFIKRGYSPEQLKQIKKDLEKVWDSAQWSYSQDGDY